MSPATLEQQALRGSHPVRRADILLGLFALVVGLLVAKKSEQTWTGAAASLLSLSHWNTLVTYAWFLRLLSALTLPDSIHWGIAAPFAVYVCKLGGIRGKKRVCSVREAHCYQVQAYGSTEPEKWANPAFVSLRTARGFTL